jgi:integrase
MTAVTMEAVIEQFLEYKRALGRKYHSEEKELRLLLRFVRQRGVTALDEVTAALLEDFLASRPRSRPRSFNHLRGVVACLFDWAVSQQLLENSPLRTRRRRVTTWRIPFVFDTAQVRQLLRAAAALPDNPRAPERGLTYRCIFALCYGLGLRVGEVCGLRLGDVDLEHDVLVVRGGKFGKSRLVPFGPRIAELLGQQVQRRQGSSPITEACAPLFSFNGRTCVHPGTVSQTFHRLVSRLDLPLRDGVSPPRLHDLRHSFAVGRLLRWYREGVDPSTHLLQLSTFLGHVDPSSTAVYLKMTPELLEEANSRFEFFARPAWEEVPS